MILTLLPGALSICRLPAGSGIPAATRGLWSVTSSATEVTVVCAAGAEPPGAMVDGPWRAVELEGPMPFTLTGILVGVLGPLAEAGVGIFAVSTFDTDFVLVKSADADTAMAALAKSGYDVRA